MLLNYLNKSKKSYIFPSIILLSFIIIGFRNAIIKEDFFNSSLIMTEKKKEKTGKSDKHTNQKKKKQATKKLQELKDEYIKLRSKPNKTASDKKKEKELLKLIKHWEKEAKKIGETHWRKGK